MSIIIQKETTHQTLHDQFIHEQGDTLEIISFLEQIRSFQIPTEYTEKESIPITSLRFEN